MGTIEGLLTAPVRTSEVVLAKYFATVFVYVIIVAPVILFFPMFQLVTGEQGAFSPGALWGSLLGLLLPLTGFSYLPGNGTETSSPPPDCSFVPNKIDELIFLGEYSVTLIP